MDATPSASGQERTVFTIALVIAAIATFALPYASETFLFGGHGFGTRIAQALFWVSWRAVARVTGDYVATNEVLIAALWLSLSFVLFALPGLALYFVTRNKWRRVQTSAIFSWLVLYLFLLFVWPQATFGP